MSSSFKVLFKGSNNLAYGVEYERNGVLYMATANKEVILSAGTVGSPKILMLSGVGNEEQLVSHGVRWTILCNIYELAVISLLIIEYIVIHFLN